MMSYTNLILVILLLQCVNARVFTPVKPWVGGFIETFSVQEKSYEDLPWNRTVADSFNWKPYEQLQDPDLKLTLYCRRKDMEICALLDEYGNIAGVQFSAHSGYVKNGGITDEHLPHFQSKIIEGKPHWTLTAYFVVHRTLRKGGRKRQIKSLGIGLWIQLGQETVEIPLKEEDLAAKGWKQQSCAESKGTYHLLETTSDSEFCVLPYVPTTHDGLIVGMTFLLPGICPRALKKGQVGRKTNFIGLDEEDVKELFPDAPDCLKNLARTRGLCSAHVGFVTTPPSNEVECHGPTLVERVVDKTKSVLDKGIDFFSTGNLF